ncbi:DUF2987 domain-containing protein [Rheinheimera maricola]|uniref:DUF2987 domain-containing protein n=1 Tax=Rheinheimera maricola TaxID=2793282 RepID=A0ABS7X8K3_9GAMM|nr:DUF2987 domain-containing protein [Rheinheimera maricola]MBZ9610952.1 DUF2987 domain-containing protein [Rheinheimera maricola]
MRYLMPLALLLAAPVSADLVLNYNGFYGRMKKLQQPQYSDITLAFALTEQQSGLPCQFYQLKLVSDRHDLSLEMAGNGEISLPYDEALKDSNAVLQVLQADNSASCQVQFRLRSRMRLPTELTLSQLQHYRSQFDVLLDDMSGMSKYWLPDVIGVIVEFADDVTMPPLSSATAAVTSCQGKRCVIRLDTVLTEDSRWLFQQRPIYLLPLIDVNAN